MVFFLKLTTVAVIEKDKKKAEITSDMIPGAKPVSLVKVSK